MEEKKKKKVRINTEKRKTQMNCLIFNEELL